MRKNAIALGPNCRLFVDTRKELTEMTELMSYHHKKTDIVNCLHGTYSDLINLLSFSPL